MPTDQFNANKIEKLSPAQELGGFVAGCGLVALGAISLLFAASAEEISQVPLAIGSGVSLLTGGTLLYHLKKA